MFGIRDHYSREVAELCICFTRPINALLIYKTETKRWQFSPAHQAVEIPPSVIAISRQHPRGVGDLNSVFYDSLWCIFGQLRSIAVDSLVAGRSRDVWIIDGTSAEPCHFQQSRISGTEKEYNMRPKALING